MIQTSCSTLLKSDQWLTESDPTEINIRGAINFRNVPETNIYALGQPTQDAILSVIERVKEDHPEASKVIWITLREEPIVYINGKPLLIELLSSNQGFIQVLRFACDEINSPCVI